jgi:hypothetical protein
VPPICFANRLRTARFAAASPSLTGAPRPAPEAPSSIPKTIKGDGHDHQLGGGNGSLLSAAGCVANGARRCPDRARGAAMELLWKRSFPSCEEAEIRLVQAR